MIPESYRKNFDTLQSAFENGEAALVECTERDTGKQVFMICVVGWDGKEYMLVPFTRMVDGDPFEQYAPPEIDEDCNVIPQGEDR